MTKYVLGIDAGTESIRSGVFDEKGKCLAFAASENKNIHRHPGWGEQNIMQWEQGLTESIREAVTKSGVDPSLICGIGVDGTSCTVVVLDEEGAPLRDAIMWMDIRAAAEAVEIGECGDDALEYVGFGKVSPEWFPCKLLWLKRHENETYRKAGTFFEHTDWMVYKLTGEITGNINTTTIRWFYNSKKGGFPESLYRKIQLEEALERFPERIVRIGETAGTLTKEMAEATGLTPGIPVAGGGADAYMGVVGVNALKPGKLALITGSSQLHIGLSDKELHAPGIFGSFPDAILPGVEVVEAGQISTGSILKWFTTNFINHGIQKIAEERGNSIYEVLGEAAQSIPPGSEGLIVLEHWQGNRTPWVDAASRGVIRGFTLKHTPAHVFRAIMEGVVYGTQVILKRFEENKYFVDEIIACGGATRSPLWMQIHADVTGKRITIPEEQEAVTLGSAIAATVAAGIYPDLNQAAKSMVAIARVIEPNLKTTAYYDEFVRQYIATYENLKEDSRKLVDYIE